MTTDTQVDYSTKENKLKYLHAQIEQCKSSIEFSNNSPSHAELFPSVKFKRPKETFEDKMLREIAKCEAEIKKLEEGDDV